MDLVKYIKSNFSTILLILFTGIVFFSADARTFLIQGMMRTGLYHADPKSEIADTPESISSALIFRSEDGELLDLSKNKGEIYFINFWATWCPPCRAEMPSINALASQVKNKDNIHFIMVDVDNKISSSVNFMRKKSYQLKVYTIESALPEHIFNGTLPTTIIIGPKGTIVFKHTGMADYDNAEMLNFLNSMSL